MITSEAVASVLGELGVERVFGYPGGRVIELFESLPEVGIEVVRPRDEREASVMAEMHGRLTRKPGVLIGQGPWIGSLGGMGQMEAKLSSSPMVVLTEASERGDYSTVAPYQQSRGDYGGLDLPSILESNTKEYWFPRTPPETIRSVQLAFKHAVAGRPGPTAVIFDGRAITETVPSDPIPPVWDAQDQSRTWTSSPAQSDIDEASGELEDAERPVVIAGNGVHASNGYDALVDFAETFQCVVTSSYLGKSTIPETHSLAGGVIGAFGHEEANQVVSEADVLVVVGCRLNPMDTNWQARSFIRPDEQTIIHIDIDPRNTGWVYPADIGLVGDATNALRALIDTEATASEEATAWAEPRAEQAKDSFWSDKCDSSASPVKPQRAAKEIQRVVDTETIITADSGNNRFWLANYVQTPAVRTYFGSGGVGGMGWANPAAVSAALETDKGVIAVAGDGGFAMTMTSVETAVEHELPITFVVLNDTSLGMVRQMQHEPGDIAGVEFHDTDYGTIAEGFGAIGNRVDSPRSLRSALTDAKSETDPVVIDARIDRDEQMAETLSSSFYQSVGGLHE